LRREVLVYLVCLVPLAGYIIYLLDLQDYIMMLVYLFRAHINLKEQMDFLCAFGNLEIGVLGVGLLISAFSYYKWGSMDRRLLAYTVISILILVWLIVIGLNLYYQYMVSQLRL